MTENGKMIFILMEHGDRFKIHSISSTKRELINIILHILCKYLDGQNKSEYVKQYVHDELNIDTENWPSSMNHKEFYDNLSSLIDDDDSFLLFIHHIFNEVKSASDLTVFNIESYFIENISSHAFLAYSTTIGKRNDIDEIINVAKSNRDVAINSIGWLCDIITVNNYDLVAKLLKQHCFIDLINISKGNCLDIDELKSQLIHAGKNITDNTFVDFMLCAGNIKNDGCVLGISYNIAKFDLV